MPKIILYPLIIVASAALGFFVSTTARHSDDAPQTLQTPNSFADNAQAMASNATAETQNDATDAIANFAMPNLAGGDSTFSDWQGQPRLVNFWATWCAPCRREIPLLKALQSEQAVDGLQVIGIAYDEMAAVADYAQEIEFNYPILVGELESVAAAESFGLELMAIPFTLVVSSEGQLVHAHIGEVDEPKAKSMIDVLSQLEQQTITLAEARTALTN